MRPEHWLYTIPLRLRSLFRWTQADQELDDELRDHLERKTEEYVAQGMTQAEAHRRARLDLDGFEQTKEKCRDARRVNWIQNFVQDLRFGLRMLRKNPGFTTVAVLTLALGIGANTAIFGVVHSIVFRPLPYRDPDRLVWIGDTDKGNQTGPVEITQGVVTSEIYQEWVRQPGPFESLAAYVAFFTFGSFNLTGRGEPERLAGIEVSQSLFPLLGVDAEIGRVFEAGEDQPGAPPVVLLTHGFWQRRFASDPNIVGQAITLNERTCVIVGVLPASFDFTSVFSPGAHLDVFLPLILDKESRDYGHYLGVLGRLRPGVQLAAAQQQMEALVRQERAKDPYSVDGVWLVPLQTRVVAGVRSSLLVLFGAVTLVLLIACTNLVNLLLARGTSRRKEIAVRAALGAGQFRLVLQLLTESIVLALVGGLIGLALALVGVPWLSRLSTIPIPRLIDSRVDSWTLAFALFASLSTGILVGLFPALRAYECDVNDALKDATRGSTAGKHRLQQSLAVFEVSLSLVLLVGAGLLIRSFWNLLQVNPGFRSEGVIAARIDPGNKYGRGFGGHDQRLVNFFNDVLHRVSTIPGVEAAAYSDTLPLDRDRIWTLIPKGSMFKPEEAPGVFVHVITPDYFRVMGIPLQHGRAFDQRDTADSPGVVIVNQTLAQRLWPNVNAVGQTAKSGERWLQVIGVVGDVRHSGLDKNAGFEMYLALPQYPFSFMDLVVRSRVTLEALAPAIRQAIWQVDPSQPVERFRTLLQLVDTALSPRRFSMWLLIAFAASALLLAAIGTYGVMAYSVAQRTNEIGIRLALGAQRRDVLRLVVGQGAVLALIGVTAGVAGAFGLTRFLSGLLYDVRPSDPITIVAVAVLLVLVALLACYLPARRAMRVDPMVALRYE
jgi:predicted permease